METKVANMTNQYIGRVKSQIDETFSRLKMQRQLHEKEKSQKPMPRQKKCFKRSDNGAGDTKNAVRTMENDLQLKKLQRMKTDCYNTITQKLKILQQVDRLSEDLYKNHLKNA
jgi:hypothetical protein